MIDAPHDGGGTMSTDAWKKRAAVLTARELRKNMTAPEAVLWEELRNRRLDGLKFCRQQPIGVELNGREVFVVADFFCHERSLVIEIDGSIHQERQEQDRARTNALRALGLQVVRFTNTQVLHDLDSVLHTIRACTALQRDGGRSRERGG
jgi:very-short-patch-repair endonuclease